MATIFGSMGLDMLGGKDKDEKVPVFFSQNFYKDEKVPVFFFDVHAQHSIEYDFNMKWDTKIITIVKVVVVDLFVINAIFSVVEKL